MEQQPRTFSPDSPDCTRAYNCLASIFDVRPITPQLVAEMTPSELLRTYNLGKTTLRNIELWLGNHGLFLKNSRPKFKSQLERILELEKRVAELERTANARQN